MNIALFCDAHLQERYDGVTVETDQLAREMLKRGHKVLLISLTKKRTRTEMFNGYEIHLFKAKEIESDKAGHYYRKRIPKKRILNILEEFKPDLIHLHSSVTTAYWAMIIANKLEIPLVSTFHTYMIHMLCLFLQAESDIKKTSLKIAFENRFLKKITLATIQNVGEFIYNSVFRSSDIVTTPSRTVKKYLEKKGLDNATVVYNWVKEEEFPNKRAFLRKKLKLKNNDFLILHTGRISGEKRIDVLIKALAHAKDEMPNAKILVTGKGPQLTSLQRLADKSGVKDRVIFTGFISNAELDSIHYISDVFSCASPFDTFNLCVLDALRHGLPIIGSNSEGVGELIEHKYNGFEIGEGKKEIENYAKWFKTLYDNPKLKKKMGKNAIESSKKYEYDKVMDEMVEVYKKAIKKGRKKQPIQDLRFRMRYITTLSLLDILKPWEMIKCTFR